MQPRAPPHQRCDHGPLGEHRDEAADEQRLHEGELGMRRHLEAAQLEQSEPATAPVRAVQLVDAELGAVRVAGEVGQQVPERPVDDPREQAPALGPGGEPAHLFERDLHLVHGLGPALVEARRLARRADEPAREQIGETRMPLPVRDEAREQLGAAQERGLDRLPAAEGQVVPAAGALVGAVEVELLGGEADGAGVLVQREGEVALLGPRRRRLHVDLDHPGVGGDRQLGEPRVRRRAVALEHELLPGVDRGQLDDVEQVGVALELLRRRQEDEDVPVALLDRESGRGSAVRADHGDARDAGVKRRAGLEVRRLAGPLRVLPRDGVQRQAQADGARAGGQHEPSAAEPPGRARPVAVGREGKHPAGRGRLGAVELGDGLGVLGLVGARSVRLAHLGGELRERILVGGDELPDGQSEDGGHSSGELLGAVDGAGFGIRVPRIGEELRMPPQRHPVGAPLQRDVPAGERLARIPLALTAVHDPAAGIVGAEALGERAGELALLWAVGGGVPLPAGGIVERDEGRLAAERERHARACSAARRSRRRGRRCGPTAARCTASSSAGPRGCGALRCGSRR